MVRRATSAESSLDPAATERRAVAAAQRDPRRFDELYEANFERVHAYVARRVRDRDEAHDVTADVFHRALRHLGGFEWRGVPFAAWLLRIAAHVIADRAERNARTFDVPPPEPVPAVDLEDAERRAALFRHVEALPPDQRRVIVLRFAEGLPIRVIAADLGRSEGAVKQLQLRALATLRARLGERHDR
jgi:RNA polymerase sigma-70 factor (ECF subfamily)